METHETNTLAAMIRNLEKEGYSVNFRAEDKAIKNLNSGKSYQPSDLKIVKTFRFEGMTDPADSSELLVIEANDGSKGTISMSYGAKHSQNEQLLKEIPRS